MAILHKFQNHNWNNGFFTENSILNNHVYYPEILIIGTFNPSQILNNYADFFYGRNYFWPVFKNLFIHNEIIDFNRRMPTNGNPIFPLNPTIIEIFKICEKSKLSFADMINSVLLETDDYEINHRNNIIFNEIEFNPILDNRQKGINGLAELNKIHRVERNIKNIHNYLCKNPSIKYIYFTRKPSGVWLTKWNELKNYPCLSDRTFGFIYTPSGRRLRTPVMSNLLYKWLNPNNNYSTLNHDWLIENGVNPENF